MEFKTFQKLTTFRITNFHMYVFVLCLLLHLAGAAARNGHGDVQGQVENNCKGHNKFTKCTCDEFGVVISRSDKPEYEQAGMSVHQRTDLPPHSKRPYYYCEVCKKCGDGVLVEYKCTQKSDTVCSFDKCTDETWIFSFVLKACQPPPPPPTTTTPSSTVVSKVTRQDKGSVAAGRVTGSEVNEPNLGSSLWLQKNSRVIILALIGGVVVFFAVIMIMAVLVIRMRRQVDGLLAPGTPSSSHNSSTVSVAAAHV